MGRGRGRGGVQDYPSPPQTHYDRMDLDGKSFNGPYTGFGGGSEMQEKSPHGRKRLKSDEGYDAGDDSESEGERRERQAHQMMELGDERDHA